MEKFLLKVRLLIVEEDEVWREFSLLDFFIDEFRKYCKFVLFGDLKEMKIFFDFEVCIVYEVEFSSFIIGESLILRIREIIFEVLVICGCIEDIFIFGRDIVLNCYKLNVYSEGGFFKFYVDSLFGDDMIGIFVFCFFLFYKGGELCVNYDGL